MPHVGGVNPPPRVPQELPKEAHTSTTTIERFKESKSKQAPEDSHSSLSDASHSTTKRSTVSGTGSSHFDEKEEEGDGRVSRREQRRDSSSRSRSQSNSKSSSERRVDGGGGGRNGQTKAKAKRRQSSRSPSSSSSASDVTDVSPLPTARSDDELTRNKEKRLSEESARSKSGDRVISKPPAGPPTRARQAENGAAMGARLSWDLDSERRGAGAKAAEQEMLERSSRHTSKESSSKRSLRPRAHSADRSDGRRRGRDEDEEADPEKMNLEAVLQTLIEIESSRAQPAANANASGRLHSRPTTASSSATASGVSTVSTLSPYLEALSRPSSSTQRSPHARIYRALRDDQLSGIQKENLRLLHQIISERNLQPHPPSAPSDQTFIERARALEHARRVALLEKLAPVRRPAPSAYQRQKEHQRIARENELLVKRLRRIHPTRELTRDFLIGDYQKLYSGAFGLGLAGTHQPKSPALIPGPYPGSSGSRSRPTSAVYGKHTGPPANARVAWDADFDEDEDDEPAAFAHKSSKLSSAQHQSHSGHRLRTRSGSLTRERDSGRSHADDSAAAAESAATAVRSEPSRSVLQRMNSDRTNEERSESGSAAVYSTAAAAAADGTAGTHKEKRRNRHKEKRADDSTASNSEFSNARHSGHPAAHAGLSPNSSDSVDRAGAFGSDSLRVARRPDSAHSRASRADTATSSAAAAAAAAYDKGLSPAAAMLAMRSASTRTVRF